MAQVKGLLKALDDRLPALPSKAEEIIKELLTEKEYEQITSKFFVYKNGEVEEVEGNPTFGEYRFVALNNKIGATPVFKKGFWIFTPKDEEITEETPVLVLRKCGPMFFNVSDDKEMVATIAEDYLLALS